MIQSLMNFNSKFWFWLFILTLGGFMIYSISNILLPFICGTLVAYSLNPAASKFEQWKISRTFSTPLLILGLFIIIGAILFFAIPFLINELVRLAKLVPRYAQQTFDALEPHLETLFHYIDVKNVNNLQETMTHYIGSMLSWGLHLLATLLTNSLAIANLISLVILTPLISFYMLRDWPKILSKIKSLLPRDYLPLLAEQARQVNQVLGAYIRGQATVAFALIIIYTTGLSLTGLNFAVIIGTITGILSFIPYIGVFIGVTVAIGVALTQFSDWSSIGMVACVFLIGQILEGYFLTPKLVGNSIGLHPVWIIFALLAGGSLFGFIGIFLALPIAAVVSVFVRSFLSIYRKSPLYLGDSHLNPPSSKTQNLYD